MRFLRLCAGRSGQLLNHTALSSDAGIDRTTAARWTSILEASYVLTLLEPHHRNFNKRLIKAPKLYFLDTGLLCHLLGVRSEADLQTHPLRGAIVETFVVSEAMTVFTHHGRRPPLFSWRDRSGHEVDLVVDHGGELAVLEVKAGRTIRSEAFRGLERYRTLSGARSGAVVYGGDESYDRRGWRVQSWRGLT